MELNFEEKAVSSKKNNNKKRKNNNKIRGKKDSKESQQANSKMGDFRKKKNPKFFWRKINAHKGKRGKKKKKERNQQTKNKAQNFCSLLKLKPSIQV